MSKLGRYSADRKKMKDVTAAKTVQVAECGTIFNCSGSSVAPYSITLPTLAAAGDGWWCKFILVDADSQDLHIVSTNAGAIFSQVHTVTGSGRMIIGAGTASFIGGTAIPGDSVEFIAMPNVPSGAAWSSEAHVSGSGALTGSA